MRVLGLKPTEKKIYYAIADMGLVVDKGVLPKPSLIDEFLVDNEINFIIYEKGFQANYKGSKKKISASSSHITFIHILARNYGIPDKSIFIDDRKLHMFEQEDKFISVAVQTALSYGEELDDVVIGLE